MKVCFFHAFYSYCCRIFIFVVSFNLFVSDHDCYAKAVMVVIRLLGSRQLLMKHSSPEKHLPHLNIDPVYMHYVQNTKLYLNIESE